MQTLRTPMPVVVRINRTKPHWEELHRSFAEDLRWSQLPWFPGAWQCDAKEYDDALRSQCSALNKSYALRFQEGPFMDDLLIKTKGEAASLVPPLLLEVKPQDLLLDLCAAPGSKTLECIELMRENGQKSSQDGETGVVIANDADAERCFELLPLITRKARYPGCAVVLGNGAKYPAQFRGQDDQLLYDKVVCDVPCSGDGTLRRRPHCWKSWSVDFPLTLHQKQLLILCRGLHLLRPGGRLVYSTCSMNPIENEAVVTAALARFGGDVRLEPSDLPKELRAAKCLQTWWVPDPQSGCFYKSWTEVPTSQRKPSGVLVETMFSSGELDPRGCFRLNPHEIDGSGFFVAIFTKTAHRSFPVQIPSSRAMTPEIPWRARNENNRYTVVSTDNSDVQSIVKFYGLRDLPEPLVAEYNIKGKLTQLNLVNSALLQLLQSHLNCKGSPLLVSLGIPLFKLLDDNFMTNIDVPSRWRPAMEGAHILAQKMEKRVLRISLERMRKLLMKRLLPMQSLLTMGDGDELKGLESCEEKLGGAVVGTMDGSFWVPCIITGSGLELYASLEEVGDPLPKLLPPLRPPVISATEEVMVLDKPSGLRTEDALRFVQQKHPAAELVSRLDKETSGCLLIPLTALTAKEFTQQFAEAKVQKCYVAVVHGHPPEKGHITEPLRLVQLGGGTKYRAFVDETGKAASTRYERIWGKPGGRQPSRFQQIHASIPMATKSCRFWAVRLAEDPVQVEVPPGEVLCLSRACQSSFAPGVLRLLVRGVSGTSKKPSKDVASADFAFNIASGGSRLGARLAGASGLSWQFRLVAKGEAPAEVDVLGYFTHQPVSQMARRKPRKRTVVPNRQVLREVRLPPGWAALSFKDIAGRMVVSEVPKACFSSAAYGAAAAPQVSNVVVGDEIASINGHSPAALAQLIAEPNHSFNNCSSFDPPHVPGTVGKLQSPCCISCDFIRRHQSFGLDIALQMWLRVVKQQMPITLGVLPKTHLHHDAPKSSSPSSSAPMMSPEPLKAVVPEEEARPKAADAPKAFVAGYNPLKPAAAGVARSVAAAKPKANAAAAGGPMQHLPNGLSFQELPAKGAVSAGKGASIGSEVDFRFTISLPGVGNKQQVLERGQVQCILGQSELKDGWVDGNVDLEQVLSTWGKALTGMRAGQRRRVHVPSRFGFDAEVVPSGKDLIFEVDMKGVK
eukprot:s29_g9.t2